ncbi:MAG: hypothetical protein AAFX81_02675 [Pseudomonadota bacterium]
MRWLSSPWTPAAVLAIGICVWAFAGYHDPAMDLLLQAYQFCFG